MTRTYDRIPDVVKFQKTTTSTFSRPKINGFVQIVLQFVDYVPLIFLTLGLL